MLRCCAIVVLGLSGACSSPGPTPVEYARQTLPTQRLDPADQNQIDRDTARALGALRAGRIAAAQRDAESIIRFDPRAARARAILGRCLVAVAKRTDPPELAVMERAEGEILLALRVDPKDAVVQLLHAEFLEADGQVSLAAKVLDHLLASHPNARDALRAASRLRFELGEERLALPLLLRLLEQTPRDADAVYRLAHCRLRLAEAAARNDTPDPVQRPDAARKAYLAVAATFRRYQNLKQSDIDGYLGEVHARFLAIQLAPPVGDAPAVRKSDKEVLSILAILDRAAQVDPRSPGPNHSRGVIHEHFEETAKARTAYEAALAKDSEFLPSILNMARLLDANGEKKLARVYCQLALKLDVSDSERNRLQQYLQSTDK